MSLQQLAEFAKKHPVLWAAHIASVEKFSTDSPASPDQPNSHDASLPPSPCPTLVPSDGSHASSDSEADMECDNSTDGFTLVKGKRKRPQRLHKTSNDSQSSGDDSPPSPTPPAKKKISGRPSPRVPAKITTDDSHNITCPKAQNTAQGIRIHLTSVDDFRVLTKHLRTVGLSFHTFALPEERILRVVVRGIPVEVSTDAVLDDLAKQGIPMISAKRMTSARTKKPIPLLMLAPPTRRDSSGSATAANYTATRPAIVTHDQGVSSAWETTVPRTAHAKVTLRIHRPASYVSPPVIPLITAGAPEPPSGAQRALRGDTTRVALRPPLPRPPPHSPPTPPSPSPARLSMGKAPLPPPRRNCLSP
ncbi:uncharacterized protein [Battus philenor]|uniref:uncharacterized protein n=1 Tax=Battus philenor TaxID=42288 RepID=UPI0035CEFBF0